MCLCNKKNVFLHADYYQGGCEILRKTRAGASWKAFGQACCKSLKAQKSS